MNSNIEKVYRLMEFGIYFMLFYIYIYIDHTGKRKTFNTSNVKKKNFCLMTDF